MKVRGFTLVELITVMVLVGILAVAALPRFFDPGTFESRGFFDETKSLLRYAQKTAVAQRRAVCVTLNAGGVVLTIAGGANAANCNTALALPNPPRGGGGLNASVAAFRFNSDGSTDRAADVIVSIDGVASQITVDRVTGYVR